MNELLNLIDKRIEKHSRSSKGLISVPCRVLEIFSNNTARVLVLENGAEYTVSNYSGSDLLIGENVQLFCQGSVSSGRFMYIGAAVNKQSDSSSFGCVIGNAMTGEVFSNERIVSRINIYCKSESPCSLFFNATIFGNLSGDLKINCYIDEIIDSFIVTKTIRVNEHSIVSFSLPFSPTIGSHSIEVSATGVGNIISLNSYVLGNQIEKFEIRDTTDENDYTYICNEEQSDIVFYVGDSKYPEVPTTLQELPVKNLLSTSFNYSEVTSAYIPEGVEEIR